jgi:hypothetical protein
MVLKYQSETKQMGYSMKMIKILSIAVGLLSVAQIEAGCNSIHGDGVISPIELRPPLGLVSFAGDGQVTLVWDSANSHEERYPPSGFSIYMATGDFTDSPCAGSINKYQLVESEADPNVGPVCGYLGVEFSQNYRLTEDGDIVPALLDDISDYTVPGNNSRVIISGEPTTDLYATLATAREDDDNDETAATAVTTAVEDDLIELVNGTTYTFFVTVRSGDDYSDESITSNWVAVTPRAEIDYLSLAIGDCYDLDSLEYATACTDTSDLQISLTPDPRPHILISGINGAQLMDAGGVDSFADVSEAPELSVGGYLATGAGVVALPGHVYVVHTNSGYYGKVFVSEITGMLDVYEEDGTICRECLPNENTFLNIRAALQTNGRQL